MFSTTEAQQVIGGTAYDSDGDKVGKVGQIFLDDQTGEPEFLTVNTGFFGSSESFVPVANATVEGNDVRLPFQKDKIKDAPKVDLDGGHLDQAEESRLYDYYAMSYSGTSGSGNEGYAAGTTTAATTGTTTDATFTEGHDTSGPTTDSAMTVSEEHLEAGTRVQEAGRARLRKYVITEQESITVPVTKERAVLTTEPITEANVGDAVDGPAISEEEHEVVLHEERAVAGTVTEPVERVSLGTETVQTEETVAGEVRKEHVEVEGDVDTTGTTGTTGTI